MFSLTQLDLPYVSSARPDATQRAPPKTNTDEPAIDPQFIDSNDFLDRFVRVGQAAGAACMHGT